MKFLATLFFALTIIGGTSSQVVENTYSKFQKDSIYVIMDSSVIIRTSPDTNGMVMARAYFGEEVTILNASYMIDTCENIPYNWYQVKYNDMDVEKTGYLPGYSLAIQRTFSTTDPSLSLMYRPWSLTPKEYFDSLTLQLILAKGGKIVHELKFAAIGGLYTYNSMASIGNKGVSNLKDIFKINFSDDFCGGAFADILLFTNKDKIQFIMKLDEGFDAPYFATNTFIFPTDENGKKKWIIQVEESGYVDDNDKTVIEDFKKSFWRWNGNQLVLVKTSVKR